MRMTTTGNCFRCREPGHWINDCPLKLNADHPPPSIHCPCGGGFCEIKVSNTRENPGRRFYKCHAAQSCRFFKWCDKVTDEDIRFRPAFIIPNCPCGSGPCRRVISDSGPDSGRAYLLCCIKKGFGACGFFKWEEDVEMPPSFDAVDEIDFWVEADLILSDVESSFQAGGLPENAIQVAPPPGKECQGSVSTEDDSIFENLDAMFVSEIHSDAAVNQQGIPLFDPIVAEEEQVAVVIEPWMKTLHGDQATNCGLSKPSFKESFQLNVDEAMSVLGSADRCENVGDAVSSGSVVTTNNEQPGTGGAEWSSPNLQDVIEQYNSEKLQLESVSGKHVQVLSAFMGSYRRLKLLHGKTCCLRKRLLETEKEMACCEAETLEFGASCREVAGEMAESQKRMQETAEKLGKEVEVLKQKEFVAMKRRRC